MCSDFCAVNADLSVTNNLSTFHSKATTQPLLYWTLMIMMLCYETHWMASAIYIDFYWESKFVYLCSANFRFALFQMIILGGHEGGGVGQTLDKAQACVTGLSVSATETLRDGGV